jgi:hypothetical protein
VPGDAALVDALEYYGHRRDRLGLPVFHVLDRLAGAPRDEGETAQWLVPLGSAMADEVESLVALKPEPDAGRLSAR